MSGRVLLVVDVQNGFTRLGALASPRCLAGVDRIVRIVATERDRGALLVFTADTHAPDDPEFAVFPPHCIRGTAEAEVVDELKPWLDGAILIPKTRYSALHGTDLGRLLDGWQPEEVAVVGLCTDVCVLHTVADLRNRDWRVRVIADGVETFDSPDHPAEESNRWALSHMRRILGAEVA
ncbi:MAG: cysteine hydrolase [Acidobacteria bacterium]|nr:cysteine hydrolase [Acidobacteriota bacterium]